MSAPLTYFNEIEPYCVQWLKNLFPQPNFSIDGRSIHDVPDLELIGLDRCHFFAGIGGWEYALQLAGWPDCLPVWTGSCPCQPFSQAGKRKGEKDHRHLWPEFRRLIAKCRPPVVFGEQVASRDGRQWLAGVRADLEALGYAVGAADLCAAGESAPHQRQRIYWVADAELQRAWEGIPAIEGQSRLGRNRLAIDGDACRLEQSEESGLQKRIDFHRVQSDSGCASEGQGFELPSDTGRFWDRFTIVECSDGKARRFEPESFPLAHGVPNRVGKLRAYGNAIVPQVAAKFITAFMQAKGIPYEN